MPSLPSSGFSLFFFRKVFKWTGGHLLFRTVSSAVPSAGRVLTVVFGMGTGVSPGRIAARFFRYLRALAPLITQQ